MNRFLDTLPREHFDHTFSPKEAGDWLERHRYRRQRKMTPFARRAIRTALDSRTFVCVAVYMTQLPDGTRNLVDGQHRLYEISRGTTAISLPVIVFHCSDEMQVWEVYKRLDQGRKRTDVSVMQNDPELESYKFSDKQMKALNVGEKWLLAGFRNAGTGRPDDGGTLIYKRIDRVKPWADAGEDYFLSINTDNEDLYERLLKGPLPGFGILTLFEQKEKALDFWQQVVTADLSEGCQLATKAAYAVVTRPPKSKFWQAQTIHQLAECWNAFYENRQPDIPEDPNHLSPVAIRGTKFDGVELFPYKPD